MKKTTLTFMLVLMFIGTAIAQNSTITFAGTTWWVKDSGNGTTGPGNNYWSRSSDNVWIDSYGHLHLKIRYDNSLQAWTCAEVWTLTPADYGTFTFSIFEPQQAADDNVVLGTFLSNNLDNEDHLYELDVEFTHWGCSCYPNTSFSIHSEPESSIDTHPEWYQAIKTDKGSYYSSSIEWQPGEAKFWVSKQLNSNPSKSFGGSTPGNASNSEILMGGVYNSSTPGYDADNIPNKVDSDMFIHINFWLNNATPPADGQEREIVIRSVSYPTGGGKATKENLENQTTDNTSQSVLGTNYPNPFGNTTLIDVNLPEDVASAHLTIYNEEGKEVQNITIANQGKSTVEFSKGDLPAGAYFYALIVDGIRVDTRKMIIK